MLQYQRETCVPEAHPSGCVTAASIASHFKAKTKGGRSVCVDTLAYSVITSPETCISQFRFFEKKGKKSGIPRECE